MKVQLNGEPHELASALDVEGLVKTLGLPASVLLIEHNEIALRREEWAGRQLQESDRLEIIRIAAGG